MGKSALAVFFCRKNARPRSADAVNPAVCLPASLAYSLMKSAAVSARAALSADNISTQANITVEALLWVIFGFNKTASAKFSIGLTENSLTGLPSLLLTDKVTGTITDLSKTPVYNFTAYEGDNVQRFTLGFADFTRVKPETDNHSMKAYAYGRSLFITQANPQKGSIYIFNAMGQLIMSENLTSTSYQEINTHPLVPGMYMVTIITAKGAFNQKVVVGN